MKNTFRAKNCSFYVHKLLLNFYIKKVIVFILFAHAPQSMVQLGDIQCNNDWKITTKTICTKVNINLKIFWFLFFYPLFLTKTNKLGFLLFLLRSYALNVVWCKVFDDSYNISIPSSIHSVPSSMQNIKYINYLLLLEKNREWFWQVCRQQLMIFGPATHFFPLISCFEFSLHVSLHFETFCHKDVAAVNE